MLGEKPMLVRLNCYTVVYSCDIVLMTLEQFISNYNNS